VTILLPFLKFYLQGHVNCFYLGEVEEYPKWVVTASLCHGIQ
jgi:hypothetical protein